RRPRRCGPARPPGRRLRPGPGRGPGIRSAGSPRPPGGRRPGAAPLPPAGGGVRCSPPCRRQGWVTTDSAWGPSLRFAPSGVDVPSIAYRTASVKTKSPESELRAGVKSLILSGFFFAGDHAQRALAQGQQLVLAGVDGDGGDEAQVLFQDLAGVGVVGDA